MTPSSHDLADSHMTNMLRQPACTNMKPCQIFTVWVGFGIFLTQAEYLRYREAFRQLKTISANSPLISWRKIHRWCGLFLASFTVFYCLTGLLLNHRKDFDYFITRETVSVPIQPLKTAALHGLLQECRTIIGRNDAPRVIRIPDKDTIEFLYGSHGKTTYRIRPNAAVMEVIEKKPREPFNWLNSLHKISGEKNVFWLICADLFCLTVLILTISGLTIMRYQRRDYLLLIAGVLTLFLGMALA